MPFGNDLRHNEADAVSATAEQRELEYEDRWQQGGLPFLGAYADLLFSRTRTTLRLISFAARSGKLSMTRRSRAGCRRSLRWL